NLVPATAIPCRMSEITISRRDMPERIAARIYAASDRLMRDQGVNAPQRAATRADLYDDPARAYGALDEPGAEQVGYEAFFTAIKALESVEDIPVLRFGHADQVDPFGELGPGTYRKLEDLRVPSDLDLTLIYRGRPVAYDFEAMRNELVRLMAEDLATRKDKLDAADFDVLSHGAHRGFPTLPVGDTLPQIYLAGPGPVPAGADPLQREDAEHLRGFLALADGLIATMNADLANLRQLYSAEPSVAHSYADMPPVIRPDHALSQPHRVAADISRLDPWRDRRTRMLDHLLALYGEAIPAIGLERHQPYEGAAGQAMTGIDTRVRLLRRVPDLHRDRAVGPRLHPRQRPALRGFVEKLALLLDFDTLGGEPLTAPLRRARLKLVTPDEMAGLARLDPGSFRHEGNPLEMLVPRDTGAEPLAPDAMRSAAWFLRTGALTANMLREGARQDAYVMRRQADGCWRLALDAGAEGLMPCTVTTDRAGAIAAGNALRASFARLNREAEGLYVVEDILLRDPGEDQAEGTFAPMTLHIVASGWTARTSDPGFRSMAEDLARDLCPAHLLLRFHWRDWAGMRKVENLHWRWRRARARGTAVSVVAAKLRAELAGEGAT
ncbi:MAG: hypothetical protein AAFV09_13890, partial [Pseudomonadota bacterium]